MIRVTFSGREACAVEDALRDYIRRALPDNGHARAAGDVLRRLEEQK